MGAVTQSSDVYIGKVLWLRTRDAVPPIGNYDTFALAKLHPYVCTGVEVQAPSDDERRSVWLMTTSDQYRGDANCVISHDMKTGDTFWTAKDSYFRAHNCVVVTFKRLVDISKSDMAAVENTVKVMSVTDFGLKAMVFLPEREKPKQSWNVNAAPFVPPAMRAAINIKD